LKNVITGATVSLTDKETDRETDKETDRATVSLTNVLIFEIVSLSSSSLVVTT